MKLPGTRLLAIARFLIDASAIARVLEPLVADWQREYIEASSATRRWVIRGYGVAAFTASAVRCLAMSKPSAAIRYQGWVTLTLFAFAGTSLGMLPFVLRWDLSLELLLLLLPSTLSVSVPLAVLPLAIRVSASSRQAGRSYTTRLTLAIMAVVIVLSGWSVPYANQAFRERLTYRTAEQAGKLASYRPPARGLRELTLSEVFVASLLPPIPIASPSKVREELFRRVSLPFVPVLLAALGWGLTRISSSAGGMRLVGWWVFACVTYGVGISLGMTLERFWGLPREVATWLPLVLWCGAIVVLMRATPSASGDSAGLPLTVHRHR